MLKALFRGSADPKTRMIFPRGPDGGLRFNMGCGHNRMPGFVNVDASAVCAPDVVFDLESLPWPWDDSIADAVVFNHSLEHMGQSPRLFLGMMKELYRICKHDAEIYINVPHPRHDHFLGDPTHVRAITPMVLSLFDKAQNDHWKAIGASNTPLAHYLGVDFRVVVAEGVLDEPYKTMFAEDQMTVEQVDKLSREANNIVAEYRFKLAVIKL